MDHIADKIEVLDSGKIFCAKAQVLVCDISKDMATDHDHESHGMATKLLKMAGPKLTGEMRRYPELCPDRLQYLIHMTINTMKMVWNGLFLFVVPDIFM